MIFTRSWLSEFIDISNISDEKILSTLNSIGFEVEGYKKITIPNGVVVGRVTECEKHPNADKLSVCSVDIGSGTETIVCGAANVAKEQLVAVATIGTQLPNGLVIKESELRGIKSYGMLCSSDELGIEKINSGILILDNSVGNVTLGMPLNSFPQIADSIFEIDITPNRSDCLSIFGIARELASVFALEMRTAASFGIKDSEKGIGRIAAVHSKNKIESSLAFKIGEKVSTEQVDKLFLINYRLAMCALKSVNPIEDLISYSTHATGVILNVFSDRAFVKSPEGKYDIYIEKDSDGFDVLKSHEDVYKIGIAYSEIAKADQNDEVLLFFASYIDPQIARELGLRTKNKDEQVWSRSSKGSEPDLKFGLDYIANLASSYHSRQFYTGSIDDTKNIEKEPIKVDIAKINKIIGEELDKNYIVGLLRKLNFEVTVHAEFNSCVVKAPVFRHDISNVYDLAEEILRIRGIDSIRSKPLEFVEENRTNSHATKIYQLRELRQKSVSSGFFETVHFIFANKKDEEKFGFTCVNEALDISNPITAELNTLRSTLLLNMLSSASKNFKNSAKLVPIFESGVVFDEQRNESARMAFVWSGKSSKDSIKNCGKPQDVDFVDFIQKIMNIIPNITITQTNGTGEFFHPYRYANIVQNGRVIGFISMLHKKVEDYFELPSTCVCEIEIDKLEIPKKEAGDFSRFQKNERDLTLIIPDSINFEYIKNCINRLSQSLIKDFFVVDIYKSNKSQEDSAITIRFILQSTEKTLSEEDTNGVISSVLAALSSEFGIGMKQ